MHNFKKFPELTNNQMQIYYFESPHKQITENFRAEVVKVTDGDTIRVKADFRDFDFPIRMRGIAAAELNEGGEESKEWLENKILDEEVMILIDKGMRVGKWGRLLGKVMFQGLDVGEEEINKGLATSWENRKDNQLFNLNAIEIFE